jgi:1-acyl-sn-glycerol-3-phosphate acyltransferase
MRPPPWWIRRFVLAPLVVVFAALMLALAPLWMLAAVVLSPFVAGRLRPVRLLWLITVYSLVEAVALGVMLVLWLAAGCGWRIRRPAFQRAHYRLCGQALRILYRQARWVLRLSVHIGGASPDVLPVGRPLIVLCRHAGPGDSFLLAHALINWYSREPRIVLKNSLLWDPTVDVLLSRLPNRFIVPGAARAAVRDIAELATGLDANDALVIFPEGGNFTPERWRRAIDRLRRLGLPGMARRAERMRNVLPPQPGGVLAALEASDRADVALVGHTGVDHLRTVADVWRALPMDKTITMRWWLEPAADVPRREDERIEWLYRWWARIDEWISTNRPEAAARPGFTAPPRSRLRGPQARSSRFTDTS